MKILRIPLLAVSVGLLAFASSAQAMTEQERRDHLDWMLKSLNQTPVFNEWQKTSGELPPDFDALPRNNYLPEPLQFLDGRPVKSAADWEARRAEIKALFEKYMVGTVAPHGKITNTTIVDETKFDRYFTRTVKLEYGPAAENAVTVTLTVPNGTGPFPVLIGGTAASLLRRGYIACSYSGNVDTPMNLQKLYPGYDFASQGQRAWAAQLVVDYLCTMPQVDKARIAITGYSREGKMATLAAAWDDRIAALVAGSTGVGGVLAWRLTGEYGTGAGVESVTNSFPIWYHPRLRFFAGKEDRLPIDANLLVAMIAPRAVLIEYGLNDEVSNTWGNEQVYYSARKVYDFLKQPDRVSLLRVPGFHGANDVEAYLDWLDIQFGRSSAQWDNKLMFSWNREEWLRKSGEKFDLKSYPAHVSENILAAAGGGTIAKAVDWEKKASGIRSSIQWMLGDEPPSLAPAAPRGARSTGSGPAATAAVGRAGAGRAAPPPGPNPGQLRPDVPAWVIDRNSTAFGWFDPSPEKPAKSIAALRKVSFGYNLTGDLYYPKDTPADARLPVVIWLHGFSYPLGYMWVYRTDLHPVLALVQSGYAVLAYDQAGFGSRMGEFAPFYDRFPHWSLMGQMVSDVRKAVDALTADPALDPNRISVFGYSVGATVGLYATALDPRIKSLVSVSGFTPMRTDTADRGTGGLARYSDERALLPRLGFFIGHESQLPYDFNEVLGAIAPRPVLVVEPSMDRTSTPAEVRRATEDAKKTYGLYGAWGGVTLYEPADYTRLTTETENWAIRWLNAVGAANGGEK